MARKSRVLRLEQSQGLLEAFTSAGLSEDYRGRFIRDMTTRLERGKGLSTRQRSWLDTLIEEGVPEPKGDRKLMETLESAAALRGMESGDAKILREFAGKVRNGWGLSEKQTEWAARLLAKADHIREHGVWEPSLDQLERLKVCKKLGLSYSNTFWSTHPGSWKSYQSVCDYLASTDMVANRYRCEIVLKMFNTKLVELFEKPRFSSGDIAFDAVKKDAGLVCGQPTVDGDGRICYPVLIGEEHQQIPTKRLRKRRPRG